MTSHLHISDNNCLADELHALGVFFLGGGHQTSHMRVSALTLLTGLAASDEERLRLSLIPLLLRQPAYSAEARAAVALVSGADQLTLKCYYTAALFLQQKYRFTLQALLGEQEIIPDLFSAELGVSSLGSPDQRLQHLADRHSILTDRYINWLGSYEHAAQRFMASLQYRQQWQRSKQSKL